MSDQFFTDAPQHPKQQTAEGLAANAKPPRVKRDLPLVEEAAEDDLDMVMRIVGMIKHRNPHSRARLLNAIRTLLDS